VSSTEGIDPNVPEITIDELHEIMKKHIYPTHLIIYRSSWIQILNKFRSFQRYGMERDPTLYGLKVVVVDKEYLSAYSKEIQEMLLNGKPVVIRIPKGL